MKVPKHIKDKMHRIAKLNGISSELSKTVDDWFIKQGLDIEELRCGDGGSLDELDFGNDITDIICEKIEKQNFGKAGIFKYKSLI